MNKKYILKLCMIVSVALGVSTSCSDFLEVEPRTSWKVEEYYDSPQNVDLAIAGLFSKLSAGQAFGGAFSMEMAYGTDEGYYSRGWDENWPVSLYSHVSNSTVIQNSWSFLYGAINSANLMINGMDSVAINAAVAEDGEGIYDYSTYKAEARFLRAFSYMTLASWWNEVPLRTEATVDQSSNHVALASLEEVYALIEEDFKYAAEHLPHAQDAGYIPGRPNKMAAHGLLARTYLKMAGYSDSQDYQPMAEYYDSAMVHCDIIMEDGWHQLRTSSADTLGYRHLFLDYIGGSYDTKESMFEITYKNNLDIGMSTMSQIGNMNGLSFDLTDGSKHPTTQKAVAASPVFNLIYDQNDKRKEWNVPAISYNKWGKVISVTNTLAPQYTPGKFRRWEPANYDHVNTNEPVEDYVLLTNESSLNRNQSPINWPVLRYSDILLMYAEAANEVNGAPTEKAINCLDEVRSRAGLEPIRDVSSEKVANKEVFLEEIMDERLREFAFEGLRKHDLIRWNKLGERLQYLNTAIEQHPNYSPTFWALPGYMRCINNFDESKHMSLPYPLQEVNINNKLDQKAGW